MIFLRRFQSRYVKLIAGKFRGAKLFQQIVYDLSHELWRIFRHKVLAAFDALQARI
jgi:hypothetical protein